MEEVRKEFERRYEELRVETERELRSRIERELRPKIKRELREKIEKEKLEAEKGRAKAGRKAGIVDLSD